MLSTPTASPNASYDGDMLDNTRLSAAFSVMSRLNETNNNDDVDSEDEEAIGLGIGMFLDENLFQDDNIDKSTA